MKKLNIEKLEKEILKEVRPEHNLLKEKIKVVFDKYRPSQSKPKGNNGK